MKQIFNYHTHTYRCNHAKGEDEEYVLAAIKAGFKRLGFSDHVPYPGCYNHKSRMNYEDRLDYYASMKHLKAKYHDQIDIVYGFECEYFKDFAKYYHEIAREVDYLILGQHDAFLRERSVYFYRFQPEDYPVYEHLCIKAMETGLFKVLCHPEYVLLSVDHLNDELKTMFRNIFMTAQKTGTRVEINLNGMEKGKKIIDGQETFAYPNFEILKIARDCGCKFVYGADAHYPDKLLHFSEDVQTVEATFDSLGFKIDEDFTV